MKTDESGAAELSRDPDSGLTDQQFYCSITALG